MIQPKDELIRDAKISGIKKQVAECINAAFSKGYEICFEQKKEIEDRAYQQGLEDGKQVGYDKGYEDGAKCQDEVQYQKGLDEAWTAARHIALYSYGGLSISYDKLTDIFGDNDPYRIFEDLSASEAIEKIREYEYGQSPCHLCRFNPPGSGDGKPCTMCPAEGKVEE